MLKLYGLQGMRAKDPQELRVALRAALASGEPPLIEVPVGPMPQMQTVMAQAATARG